MDTDEKNQRACRAMGADFLLQWGNRKRLIRGMRLKDPAISQRSTGLIRRKITARSADRFAAANTEKGVSLLQSNRLSRNSEAATLIRSGSNENHQKSSSPEKEDRYYTTRGSVMGVDENGKVSLDGNRGEEKGFVWPKLFISLSNKEKEEDFMAMKGCKPPQRPKKRTKIIQRSLLMVSPGAWLNDMCRERYEVREKKGSKKRARGLKAMGSMESDSE